VVAASPTRAAAAVDAVNVVASVANGAISVINDVREHKSIADIGMDVLNTALSASGTGAGGEAGEMSSGARAAVADGDKAASDASVVAEDAASDGKAAADDASQAGTEEKGEGNSWTDDLSHVTGKTAASRNRAIDAVISEDFQDLRFTHHPVYSPWVNTGIAKIDEGTQIGWKSFVSRAQLRDTLVHEELHHRWYARGIPPGTHHPRDGSGTSEQFYNTVNRYLRMRGW
jgi:Metallopeptidase toxin 5